MNTAANTGDASAIVFLLDVDNTLLDNDQITADLRRHLEREFAGHYPPQTARGR